MMIVACPMISSCKKTHPLVLIIIVVLVLSSSLSSSSSLSFRHLDSFNAFRHPISTSISSTITITAAATRNRRTQMSATTASGSGSIDNDIAQWVSDAGYGQVKSSSHSGSSDWASFRKVRFNCVDLYLYLVSSISIFSSFYTTVLTYELPCVVVTAGGNKNKTKQNKNRSKLPIHQHQKHLSL